MRKPGLEARAFYCERKGGTAMHLIVKLVLALFKGRTITISVSYRKGR